MNQNELSETIARAYEMVNKTSKGSDLYPAIQAHFEALLKTQRERAAECGGVRCAGFDRGWEMHWLSAETDMDTLALKMQRDSLRDALVKVLDTHNREAKAAMSYQNARENFSDSSDERKAHERAMLAASNAEREARVLLLTLRA